MDTVISVNGQTGAVGAVVDAALIDGHGSTIEGGTQYQPGAVVDAALIDGHKV